MICVSQYRAAIGRWHLFTLHRPKTSRIKLHMKLGESLFAYGKALKPSLVLISLIIMRLLLLCGDINPNPGPTCPLLINHINVRSLCASDRTKKFAAPCAFKNLLILYV